MLTFYKMSGSGNDFIMIDNRQGIIPESALADFARTHCPRGLAVGADGVVLIEKALSAEADFRMRIINSDGSEPEMCGNASRCLAVLAAKLGIASADGMAFDTLAGLISAKVIDGIPQVGMVNAPAPVKHEALTFGEMTKDVYYTDTGVPHAVVVLKSEELENLDIRALGSALRHHPTFAPRGTNANFISIEEKGFIRIRTFERGVEDETLACGTGVTAAALTAGTLGMADGKAEVKTQGGETLTVTFTLTEKEATDITLSGPIKMVYEGNLPYS